MIRAALLAAVTMWLIHGCGAGERPPAPGPAPSHAIRFEDEAAAAGIDFRLGHGGRTPLSILETAGGGAAFLDFDGDGRLDILLVGPRRVGLYRGTGAGRFHDATAGSGLDGTAYWMGCSAADYDGDGRTDVLLTGYGRTALYRNEGGRFRDVSRAAGLDTSGWSLSGAFADYDRDGRLDLYVTRYLRFDGSTPALCRLGGIQSACGPEIYSPEYGALYHNEGGGKLRDVTRAAGIRASGKTWTALFSDFEGDGYPELYLANDMVPCDFFLNRGGRFSSSGAHASVAYDANGHLQGAMGADSGDFDNDGRFDLLVTTYFAQPTSLYRNDGGGFFEERGTPAGLGMPGAPYVGFGAGFLDADNDGWLDVFVANGHVRDNVQEHDAAQDYAQPMQMLQNRNGQFHEVSATAGPPFAGKLVGRGAAFGDYDGDGRVDILVCDLEGPARLLRNLSSNGNSWLRVRLRGKAGNTGALGAIVTVEHGGRRQVREIRTCGSVMAALEPVAHFGLGADSKVDVLRVRWPRGGETVRRGVAAGTVLELVEP